MAAGRGRGRGGGRQEFQLDHHREKAMRSIFVANIAFETSEDQLKAVLTEVRITCIQAISVAK